MIQQPSAPHPGWIIGQWLKEHGRSQVWLAERLNTTTKHLNMVIHGKANFSLEWAWAVEGATGIPARVLMLMLIDFQLAELRLNESAAPAEEDTDGRAR